MALEQRNLQNSHPPAHLSQSLGLKIRKAQLQRASPLAIPSKHLAERA